MVNDEKLLELAISFIKLLEPKDRVKVFNNFCRDCGNDDPKCKCHQKKRTKNKDKIPYF